MLVPVRYPRFSSRGAILIFLLKSRSWRFQWRGIHLLRMHDECRKTNVVRMNILEREQAGGLRHVGCLVEYRVTDSQLLGSQCPTHVGIERVASDFDIWPAGIRRSSLSCGTRGRRWQAAVLRALVGCRAFKVPCEQLVCGLQPRLHTGKSR